MAVRLLGEITREHLVTLQEADAVVTDEIRKAGLYEQVWQAFGHRRGIPVADALEADEQLTGVPSAAGHGERTEVGRVGVQPRAPGEPQFGLVSADTDHDITANPVRTADPADGYLHGIT